MKKSIFYYLFAVVCTVCLFTACSDDDDDNIVITVDDIVGQYPGTLDISLAGQSVAKDLPTTIVVTSVSDSKVKASLMGFTIPGVLPVPVDIEVTCDVVPKDDGELRLSGNTTVSIPSIGDIPVGVTGEADGHELDLDILVTSLTVSVDFDGYKK